MLFVLCQTQNDIFAIDADHITEIIRMVQITRLPSDSGRIDGLINYRGEMIPVMDSHRYLKLSPAPYHAESAMIVIRYANQAFSLILHEVLNVFDVPVEVLSMYESGEQDYFNSALQYENRIYPILNMKRIVQDIRLSLQNS